MATKKKTTTPVRDDWAQPPPRHPSAPAPRPAPVRAYNPPPPPAPKPVVATPSGAIYPGQRGGAPAPVAVYAPPSQAAPPSDDYYQRAVANQRPGTPATTAHVVPQSVPRYGGSSGDMPSYVAPSPSPVPLMNKLLTYAG